MCFTLYIVLNDNTKKISKKQRAGILLASAIKWAEMAADPENGRNSKILFSPAHGHCVQWRRKGMVRESKVLHKNPETSYVEEGFSVI